jgi:ribosomal protein L11 methyltransferase
VRGGSPELLERAAAEAFEAGALGIEEEDGPPPALRVYVRAADAGRVRAALLPLPLVLGPAEPIADETWSETWKEGLEAVVISPRLLVRPSFRAAPPGFAGRELVIEPGQAFGTGGHASTRLALEAVVELAEGGALAGVRVLDVGCGSGVLALAALALGAERALGCDLDPLATSAARVAARENGFGARLALVTGSLDALGPRAEGAFEGVLANLLRRELEPLLPALARALAPRGSAVLSGLLAGERGGVESALAAAGLAVTAARTTCDAGGDVWLALVARRAETPL